MKFKVFSLGCKVNSYECSAISSKLLSLGYEENNSDPDVVIINTCSVTSTADQKSRQHIRKFIKAYPKAISVVMGCYSQGNHEYIEKSIHPNILLGTSHRNEIPELIEEYKRTGTNIVKVESNTRNYVYEELGRTSFTENVRAYLKIQDGCDNFCTYCIIPYRRGKMRSRKMNDILEEAKYLVEKGYKEIVLTGIHVGGYGKDTNECSFTDLVEKLSLIDGLESLRISSIEESEIDEKLINLVVSQKNIASHLHIPLQSGSNSILKRMNRKYTREQFIEKINQIRKIAPDIAITTDIIVGFPGETEEDFNDTYNLAKECFNQLHVFPYSPREGTPAASFPNQVNPSIKKARCSKLINLSNELYKKYSSSFINKEVEVLVEKYDELSDINVGHTSNYLEVNISGLKEDFTGKFIKVKLTKSMIESE